MRVQVKQRHIDAGAPVACIGVNFLVREDCPVELAIKEALGEDNRKQVSVVEDRIYIGEDRYETPGDVWAWVEGYDAGYTMRPFDFTIGDNDETVA